MLQAYPFILLVLIPGGWDTTMVFDPKVGSDYVAQETDTEIKEGASGIKYLDHKSRPSVKKWFEEYGDNAAIVNGLYVSALDRYKATEKSLSTIPPGKNRPVDWLTFYAANLNPTLLAPHLAISSPYFPGSYGGSVVPIEYGKIKSLSSSDPANSMPSGLQTKLENFRKSEFNKYSTNVLEGTLDGDKYASLYSAMLRKNPLNKALKEIFDAIKPTSKDSEFLTSGKIALEMFARGHSLCVSVTNKDPSYWESYEDHFKVQAELFESLFSDLHAIMEYGRQKGILNSTLIIVMSERGRASKLNSKDGKSSWPYTSMLLWGPGIKPGSVSGLTDGALRGIPIDPLFGSTVGTNLVVLEPAHVFASIYLRYDLPLKLILPDIKPLSTIMEREQKASL